VAELSRAEVCLGAQNWFERHGRAADPVGGRVYECVCEHGDQQLEDCVRRLADSDEPLTLEQVQAAWERLVGMAEHFRQGYL